VFALVTAKLYVNNQLVTLSRSVTRSRQPALSTSENPLTAPYLRICSSDLGE